MCIVKGLGCIAPMPFLPPKRGWILLYSRAHAREVSNPQPIHSKISLVRPVKH